MGEPLPYVLGLDIGTSGAKAIAVDEAGAVVASAQQAHDIARPRTGWAEHDARIWWSEVIALSRSIVGQLRTSPAAICVSGMGPCLAPTTSDGTPVRAAILYGIDSRATAEISELTAVMGDEELLLRGGSLLTSQAIGPKMLWLRRHEAEVWAETKRFFMPSSYAVWKLTGNYVLDHHSASQCNPLYDLPHNSWNATAVDSLAPGLDLPRLLWPEEIAGHVLGEAAVATGISEGTPVLAGTIDAWAESVSVGAIHHGDVMVMYGSTLFITKVVARGTRSPKLWATAGVHSGTETLAAGMATGGMVASWFSGLVGTDIDRLVSEAVDVPAGSAGLLALPYFAGERTPIFDPLARGTVLGLTMAHGRGHIMKALLEAVAFGVRHNLEAFDEVSPTATRYLAVGGGARNSAWPQIVSDVTGVTQLIASNTVGAALGDAMFAAAAVGFTGVDAWNATHSTIEPNAGRRRLYDSLYPLYRRVYEDTRTVTHELARRT